MGLDQYITAYKRVKATPQMILDLKNEGLDLTDAVSTEPDDVLIRATVHIHSFRKFNALHGFVADLFATKYGEGFQDSLFPYDITDYIDQMETVLDMILKEPDKAEIMFSPTAGFFFGSTEIDRWYWEDVKELKELIPKLRKLIDAGYGIEYTGWY